jgi:LacI family transcriptional regulator
MATIKDIAKIAGVSATTVSNVIHGNSRRVSAETVSRIQSAIVETHYAPNLSARALKNNASRIIGVINHLVPRKSGGFLQDPFHGALLQGIEQELRDAGYFLMVRTIDTVAELMDFLSNWNVDGLILTGIFPYDFYHSLQRQQTPYLLIDSYIKEEGRPQIRLEDEQGGYLAASHLLGMGHRRILFCGPAPHDHGVIAERFLGFARAMAEYGALIPPGNILECEMGIDDAVKLGRVLAMRSDFTALFATADILAAGLLAGLESAGRRVPDDISIIGFDDLPVARLTAPQLTTIRQDVVRRGAAAANMILSVIRGEHPDNIMFPVSLVERGSVRRL